MLKLNNEQGMLKLNNEQGMIKLNDEVFIAQGTAAASSQ